MYERVFPDSRFGRGEGEGGFQTVFQMSLVLPLQAKEHLSENCLETLSFALLENYHTIRPLQIDFCFMGYFTSSVGPLHVKEVKCKEFPVTSMYVTKEFTTISTDTSIN